MNKGNHEKKEEYLTFYPSYWLYNAGLVSIIRTIETAKREDDNDPNIKKMRYILHKVDINEEKYYKFGENGELFIHNKIWEILPDLYVWMMSWMYNDEKKQKFWWNIFQKGNIMGNLINPALLSDKILKNGFKVNSEIDKLNYIYKFTLLINFIKLIEENNDKKDEIIDLIVNDVKRIINEILDRKDNVKDDKKIDFIISINIDKKSKKIKKVFKSREFSYIINYENLKIDIKKLKRELNFIELGKYLKQLFNKSLNIGNKLLTDELFWNEESNNYNTRCFFCNNSKSGKYFNFSYFSYEGGSTTKKGFSNFYWGDTSQIGICNNCNLILLFALIALFSHGNFKHSEFINITDTEQLWVLNEYLKELNEKEKQKSEKDKRSRLIDAITSTGVILKIKSRWLLQNVEFIEIGGCRDSTVYNLDIATIPLALLTDYTYGLIPVWLSDIEKIYISNKKYPKVIGKKLIQSFLRSEINILINNAIVVFKYIWKENFKNKNFQDNIYPNFYQLKNFLLIILSLIYKFQSTEEFYIEGRNFKLLLINKNKERNIEMFINKIFPKIITNRKEEFVNEIIRVYMRKGEPIPPIISNFLSMNNEEFKTQSLLFLTGILDKED